MTISNEMFQELASSGSDASMEKSPAAAMYELLSSSLGQAALEGRLTHGLCDCAAALSSDPSDVLICMIPWDFGTDSVNLRIQMLLVESVCLEYDILTLKVDMKLLSSMKNFGVGQLFETLDNSPELNCYLIKTGSEGLSTCERKLMYNFRSPLSEENNNVKTYPV